MFCIDVFRPVLRFQEYYVNHWLSIFNPSLSDEPFYRIHNVLDWSRLQMRSNFSGGFCGDSFWVSQHVCGTCEFFSITPFQLQGIVQPLPLSPPFPSECFSHTVLVALPTLFLCATLPVIYVQIKTSRAQPLPWTTLQSMKWVRRIGIGRCSADVALGAQPKDQRRNRLLTPEFSACDSPHGR